MLRNQGNDKPMSSQCRRGGRGIAALFSLGLPGSANQNEWIIDLQMLLHLTSNADYH